MEPIISKENALERIAWIERDCSDFVEYIENGCQEFDDPWEVHDIHNWEAILESLSIIKEYIIEQSVLK